MKSKIITILKWIGLGFLEPAIRLASGEEPKKNTIELFKKVFLPLFSIILFIGIWSSGAAKLFDMEAQVKIEKTRQGQGDAAAKEMEECIKSGEFSCKPNALPSPTEVLHAYEALMKDHRQINADKIAFNKKTAKLNKDRIAKGKAAIEYTGRPSFVDQIKTSLITVFAGFLLALFIAVPTGIIMGLSPTIQSAINPFIQIFKPVSPVVWFLLVFMVVKTVAADFDTDKSFVISFIAVGLCSMWATLVNTALGVATVDKDYINVAKVLRLGVFQNIFKIILPASLPLIFTGLRITLSVSWMVLIAIELLAQNPGLGSFVWEEFQNGANDSNAKIIVAMFVIGGIGFLLDRIMVMVQQLLSFEDRL